VLVVIKVSKESQKETEQRETESAPVDMGPVEMVKQVKTKRRRVVVAIATAGGASLAH
jgi:hypothetical protein